jgi:D-xylose transport system permease protein
MTQAGGLEGGASPVSLRARTMARLNTVLDPARDWLRRLEIDTRLLGMIGALAIIWIAFNILSEGDFLTPRNLWNLSVQSASIGIMATGMVLIIVARNIDLSVGSMLGFIGYTMAMFQAVWIPVSLGLGFDQPYTWILTVGFGLLIGASIGLFQGFIVAYGGVPSFIVTLGGLLIWRGLIFRYAQGQTIAPLDSTFRLLGGGPQGSIGEVGSWVIGIIAIVGIIYSLIVNRRRRRRYGFTLRPMWAEIMIGTLGTIAVLAAVWVVNSYPWPEQLARQLYERMGLAWPEGGAIIPVGLAYPVIILIVVGLAMTYIATRRKFGRNVYAIGGNPEAAMLSGINVKRTVMYTFGLMGLLTAISAMVQTARLNSAVTGLGITNELDVISAAVIGGTSFTGGIGTIPGAILGAVVMQSLRSGMFLLNVDSPTQDVVVGVVLVAAVGIDSYLRRRST